MYTLYVTMLHPEARDFKSEPGLGNSRTYILSTPATSCVSIEAVKSAGDPASMLPLSSLILEALPLNLNIPSVHNTATVKCWRLQIE